MNTGAEIGPGDGFPGQVWLDNKPIWITDLSDTPASIRVRHAAEAGVRSAVGFPIKSGDGVLGVIGFLSRLQKAPDKALLAILADIGSQIGHFAERRRAEEALLVSEEQYRSFFERNLAGAFRSTLDGSVLDCNNSFAQILGYPRREDVVDQEKLILQLDETRDLKDRELSIERKDGSRIWVLGNIGIVERRGQEDLIEGTLIDITARKEAESTVRSLLNISEKLNSTLKVDELMDALMAEVMNLTGADSGCSGLRSHESIVTHSLFQKGEALPFEFCWPAGVGWAGWLLIHKVPYLTNDALNDAQILPELRDTFRIRSGLSVPILDVNGEVIGFFELHNKGFTASDQRKLVGVSQIASIAIQNALAYQRLRDAESELRQLSGRLLHLQDEERRRIARHLHETVAQSLAALKMNLAIVQKSKEALDKRGSFALEEIRSLLEVCIREVRTLSYLLHPPLLDESGLPSALRWYTEGFEQRSGVRVNLQIPANLGRLSQEMETTLFRIVQECLTNIHQHSGSSTATIAVRQNAEELVLEVKDEGRGMPPRIVSAHEPVGVVGVGIAGMRERIKQLGGQMEIQSDSKGTTVKAVLRLIGGAIWQPS
jgi:PAS domain S-box-containing protein